MNTKVKIKINGTPLTVEKGTTILDAAGKLGIKIPVLCYHKDLCIAGNCRVCVVEVVGVDKLFAGCATLVWEGMEVLTNSLLVRNSRKHIIELLLSEHNADCTKCYKNGNCELQDLAAEYKITNQDFIDLAHSRAYTIDRLSLSPVSSLRNCTPASPSFSASTKISRRASSTSNPRGLMYRTPPRKSNGMMRFASSAAPARPFAPPAPSSNAIMLKKYGMLLLTPTSM